MDDDLDPTPEGLLRCLQALADEAACLSLSQTFAALQDAIAICCEESGSTKDWQQLPRGAALVH
jgi:hypothetical protein